MHKTKPVQAATDSTDTVRRWLDSSEGRKEIRQAVEQGLEICRELRQVRQVKPEALRKPFTV
jgi:arginine/lysine/ornithine decarboxylase